MESMSILKRGDLIGVNNGSHIDAYIIAQVVRYDRFFYCKSLETGEFHFVVFDSRTHFLLCPDFEPGIRPDIDVVSMGSEFYDALDRLFGFNDEDSSEW